MMARILLIDDEPQVRSLLGEVLEQHGHEVIECSNSTEGIREFKKSHFHLVIMDIVLPDKDVGETLRELKEHQKQVNVLAISGGFSLGPDETIFDIAQGLGVKAALAKPFHLPDFLTAVDQCLASSSISNPQHFPLPRQ
jgi:two-component system, cell cycle response regulator CpdR